ncbi:MAG: alpha/beta hydrolase [Actinomycetota bacterium]
MHDTVMDDRPVTGLPTTASPTGPPARTRLAAEWTTALQPWRLLYKSPGLRRAARGDGRRIVDIPGWLTGSETLAPLRWYLGSLGHDAVPWGLGRNGSDVESTVECFEPILEQLVADGDGRPVHLVGWSLGGVIARETARNRPDLVERLVTFGTPAQGGPSYTAGASRFGAEECARIAALQDEANRTDPLTLPATAIYTKADAVVDWKACIDPWATNMTHVEVGSSHFGLGVDPDVWTIVADALAA